MTPNHSVPTLRLAGLWAAGIVALAVVTWACFELKVDSATTAFVYLTVIVLLSLMDSFISSAIFSLVAVACLNFFFVEPLFSFNVAYAHDLVMLIAFIATSLAITGLVRRARRIGDIERRQAQLLDLTHDSVFTRDLDDVITYWNRGAEDLYGWTRAETLGKVTHKLLQTEFPLLLEDIKAALMRVGHWDGELVHTKRDGTRITVASRWSLQRDKDGRPLGTLETNNDITEKKRAEAALRRNAETFLAEAQQLSRTGSFGWNAQTGEIFWSEESFRIFGYDSALKPTIDMVMQRVHPDERVKVRQVIDAAINDKEGFDLEHRLMMPDGTVKHLHVVAHCATDAPDQLQFMGALMDITARKEAEERLRNSEQRYRYLFQYMPVALMRINAKSRIDLFKDLRAQGVNDLNTYLDQHPDFLRRIMDDASIVEDVNERAIEMFAARDASELIGSPPHFWRQNPEAFRRGAESRFRGETMFQEEIKIETFDGRAIDVLVTVARPEATADLPMNFIGLTDITDRVRAREMLQQLQAEFAHAARVSMLGELTASIAHEVSQPLSAIAAAGKAGMLWLDRPEPNLAEAQDLMRRIVDDARRAAEIIARIRTMAAGRVPQQVALSLRDIIEESTIFLRPELRSKGVAVSLDLAPSLPEIVGDRTQLQQVIVNLAVNAVQAMALSEAAHRAISIRAALADSRTISLVVEDSGPGIDPQHIGRLFERFFTTKDGGMGMGLSISRSIVEAHGGRIAADNGSTLGGARFTVALPIDADATN
jgi:PAS domain S-box-containing protein